MSEQSSSEAAKPRLKRGRPAKSPPLNESLDSISNDLQRLMSGHRRYRQLMDQLGCRDSASLAAWLRNQLEEAFSSEDASSATKIRRVDSLLSSADLPTESPIDQIKLDDKDDDISEESGAKEDDKQTEADQHNDWLDFCSSYSNPRRRRIPRNRRNNSFSRTDQASYQPSLPIIVECKDEEDRQTVIDSDSCRTTPSPRTLRNLEFDRGNSADIDDSWNHLDLSLSPDSEERQLEAEIILLADNREAYEQLLKINKHWRRRWDT